MTPEEFASKVDYEGGLFSALFGYGLREDHLDGKDTELYFRVKDFRKRWAELMADDYETLSDMLDGLLDSIEEEWV